MKTMIRTLILGGCMVAGSVFAQTTWTGGGGTDGFADAGNWNNGLPSKANPGVMGAATFSFSSAAGDMNDVDLTISGAADWESADGINNNFIDGSTLLVSGTGAALTSGRGLTLTNNCSLTVENGGALDFGRDFRMTWDATATMNASGQVFQVRSLDLSGDAVFTLSAGTVYLDNGASKWGLITADAGYLDVNSTSAVLKRAGDYVSVLQGQINSGAIRVNGAVVSASSFSVSFDGADTVVQRIAGGTAPSVVIGATNVAYVGKVFSLDPVVGGSAPRTSQWFKDGVALTGETNETYASTSASLADAGDWSITVSNAFGIASATTRVEVVDLPESVVWDNAGGDGLIGNATNWNPEFLPSLSLETPGVATNLGGSTVLLGGETMPADLDITFESGTTLDDFNNENIHLVSGRMIFRDGSLIDTAEKLKLLAGSTVVISNGALNLLEGFELGDSGNTLEVLGSASIDLERDWRLGSSSANNYFNWNSSGTLRLGLDRADISAFELDHASGNVVDLRAGRISAGTNGFVITAGNHINFTEESTGVLEVRGLDFSDAFADYATNGLIRLDGAVESDLTPFAINYDGTNTTMALSGEVEVNAIAFDASGFVAASNGFVLSWTTDPEAVGLDVYRTADLVFPAWSNIASGVVDSYTDTNLIDQAFYQLVPAGKTFP